LKSAFSKLYEVEKEMTQLYEKCANGNMEYLVRAAGLQEKHTCEPFVDAPKQLRLHILYY